MIIVSRNDALGFAARTKQNLLMIEKAFESGEDVHVVTQLIVSLLGLVVYPREKQLVKKVSSLRISDLEANGWPIWQQSKGEVETLGKLIDLLRHAVAHGNIQFSSDSRLLSEVSIDVENYRFGKTTPNWKAHISAPELRDFCLRFIQLIEDTIG